MLDFIFIMIAFGLGIADGGESGTSAQTPAPAAAESAGLLAGTDETMAAAAPAESRLWYHPTVWQYCFTGLTRGVW